MALLKKRKTIHRTNKRWSQYKVTHALFRFQPSLFVFSSPRPVSDSEVGIELLLFAGHVQQGTPLLMDRAYMGDRFRDTVQDLGYVPVVPPKRNRKDSWIYDKALYNKRNQVERFFR